MVNPLKITFVTTEPHVAHVLSGAARGTQSSLTSCKKNILQVWEMYSVENSVSDPASNVFGQSFVVSQEPLNVTVS